MAELDEVRAALTRLVKRSPAGLAIGLHLEYIAPRHLFRTYPRCWDETYSARGLVLHDPTVIWGLSEVGIIAWSELHGRDDAGVFAQAARFGMAFGITISIDCGGSRSLGSFARPDREFSAREVTALEDDFTILHRLTNLAYRADTATLAKLKDLSVDLVDQHHRAHV